MPDSKIKTKRQPGENNEIKQDAIIENGKETNTILETVVGVNIEDIGNKLSGVMDIFDEKGKINTALGLNVAIASHLSVIANMTTAIAGLLFGEKGINSSDAFTKLTSKIKAPDAFTEIMTNIEPDSKDNSSATIDITIAGLNKAGTKQLIEFLEVLTKIKPNSKALDVKILLKTISSLDEVINALNNLDLSSIKKQVKNLKNIDDVFSALTNTILISEAFSEEVEIFIDYEDDIKDFLRSLADIISNQKGGSIVQVANAVAELKGIGKLSDLSDSLIEIGDVLYIICEINKIDIIVNKKFKDNVEKIIDTIKSIKDKIIELDNGDGAKLSEVANICKSISEVFKGLMTITVAATVICSLCGPAIVGLFLVIPILYIIRKFIIPNLSGLVTSGELKLSFNGVEQLGQLLLVITGVLLIGALFMKLGFWVETIQFGILVMTFLSVMLFVGKMVQLTNEGFKGLNEFANLLLTLTRCLLIGALFMMIDEFAENSIYFGILLTVFVGAILGAIGLAARIGNGKTLKIAETLVKLIVVLTSALIIGALFMMIDNFANNAIGFATILTGFVVAILVIIALASKFIGKSLKLADTLVELIIVLSTALIIGALFMMIDDFAENALYFIGLMSGFVAGMMFIFVVASGFIKSALKEMIMLAIITTVMTATLLIGASFMEGDGFINAILFIAASAAYIVAFGILAAILTVVSPFIMPGLLALAGISLATMLMGTAIGIVIDASKKVSDFEKLKESFEPMIDIIVSIGYSLAKIAPCIIWISASVVALSQLTTAVKSIKDIFESIPKSNINKEQITTFRDNISTFFTEFDKIEIGVGFIWKMKKLNSVSTSISKVVSKLGTAVKNMANLKVGSNFDKDGNPTKYDQLTETHFTNAGKNIGEIISSFATAINTTYDKNKNLFDQATSGKDTPFKRVVDSSLKIGDMISNIAKGIESLANGKVPIKWDKNGKPIGFDKLDHTTLTSSVDLIKSIITNIGEAIITVYKDNEDLFNPGIFESNTPFKRVVDSVGAMGGMLSSITKGIIDIASGRIPTKWDKNNKPIEWESLENYIGKSLKDGKIDPESKLVISIKTMCTSLLQAVEIAQKSIDTDVDDIADFTNSIIPVADSLIKVVDSVKKVTELKIDEQTIKGISGKIHSLLISIIDSFKYSDKMSFEKYIDKNDIEDSIDALADVLKGENIKTICDSTKLIYDTFSKIDSDKISNNVFKSFFESVSSVNIDNLNKLSKFDKMGGGISDLVKQINSIDIEKTDKFIELSKALESLSDKMGEIDNGIFKMLEVLAARLEQTSKVIENSDNIQEKRIKNIKEQAKEISKLIDKPMTVEFKPEEKIEYGSLLKSSIFGKDKEENTKNKNIPAPHLNNNTSNNQSSSAELVSIAGTTAEIQALLYQILQQRG
jgi:hypothetical protein